jgi:prepilin-type N-terminal cleavage/methylation domain-containing protein
MENKRELRCKHGFTLAELLIVVAIISVLVVVSVPVFNAQLDKAKIAANKANIRSAEAAALTDATSNNCGEAYGTPNGFCYYNYNVASGTLVKDKPTELKKTNGVYENIYLIYNTGNQLFGTRPHYVSGQTELDKAIVSWTGSNDFTK